MVVCWTSLLLNSSTPPRQHVPRPNNHHSDIFRFSFINNEFVKGVDGKTFDSINPTNEKPIVAVQEATEKDVDIAVSAARKAFEETWRNVTPEQRGKYLVKLSDLFEQNLDQLAAIEALDNGKAFNMAKVDIGMCVGCLRYYGGWADKIEGKTINTNPESFNYTRQEPVGAYLPHFAKLLLTQMATDWCLCSNYPMEFPIAYVGMENRPCHRLWQHRHSQICGTNSTRCALRRQASQGGWLPSRCH